MIPIVVITIFVVFVSMMRVRNGVSHASAGSIALAALLVVGSISVARLIAGAITEAVVVLWKVGWEGYVKKGIRIQDVFRHQITLTDGTRLGREAYDIWCVIFIVLLSGVIAILFILAGRVIRRMSPKRYRELIELVRGRGPTSEKP